MGPDCLELCANVELVLHCLENIATFVAVLNIGFVLGVLIWGRD